MKLDKIINKVKQKSNWIIAIITIIVVILALLPILKMAKYNVPAADDYSYSITTHKAWSETHNVFQVLKEAVKKIGSTYNEWQGTFSAVFLFSLQPSIYGVEWYSLSTIILLAFLIFSNIFLVKTFAKKIFNYTKNSIVLIIALVPTILAIEYVPDARESLFWWNGASYYTLFYSIMLIAMAIIIRLTKSETKRANIVNTVIGVLLAIIIGGGNYPTALIFIMMLALITIFGFITKNDKKFNLLGITIVSIISLGISMIAPGNAVRQASCDNSLGVLGSIIEALKQGTLYTVMWLDIPIIIMFVFLIPFIYKIIKNKTFKFRYPLIFTIFTFGIFSAQFVPPLFAMNNLGGTRLLDIIYYSFYWLIGLNIAYYIGWIKNKFGDIKVLDYINNNILVYSVIIVILFVCSIAVTKDYNNLTSFVSYNSLSRGEAQEYYNQILERYKIYEDKSIQDAIIPELTVKPEQIYGADITEDKESWINVDAARYWGKESIVLEKRKDK